MLAYNPLKMKNLALIVASLALPLRCIAKPGISCFWPLLPQFLLINKWLYLGLVQLWVFSDVVILLPGFVLSEFVHVEFLVKKRAWLALRQFLKLVILYVIAKFYLSLLFWDTVYVVVIIRVLGPYYYYLAFERLGFHLVDFSLGRSGIWLFALKKGEMLAARDFVRLCALHGLRKSWRHEIWPFKLTVSLLSGEVWGEIKGRGSKWSKKDEGRQNVLSV